MVNEDMFAAVRNEVKAAKATFIAVSKQRPLAAIQRMYDLGQRDFGENRVSELQEKFTVLPKDIRWHFIGHLQRNKVKEIAPFVHLIHSGDSARLIRQISKEAAKVERTIPVLLQYHIAREESKYGLDPEKPSAIFQDLSAEDLSHVSIRGVMGMATYTDVDEQIAAEFTQLKETFDILKASRFADSTDFTEISMGMSGDYPVALQRGSTMVRVGSLLYR